MPYYAVARGSKTGVFKDWNSCKQSVIGFKGAIYKKFPTLSLAHQFIKNYGSGSSPSDMGINAHLEPIKANGEEQRQPKLHQPISRSTVSQIIVKEPLQLKVDLSDYNKIPSLYWTKFTKPESKDIIIKQIYVDGASRGNGRKKWPISGYGVFYGIDDERNAAVALDTIEDTSQTKPTNQRAELLAIKHALTYIANEIDYLTKNKLPITTKYEIYSDSRYSINCLTSWIVAWYKNGWKNTSGKVIANKDLIGTTYPILNFVNQIYNNNHLGDIQFHHVMGHRGNFGNEWADKLANIGADDMEKRSD